METGHLSKVSQRILRKRVPILLCSKPPKPSSGPPCLVMNDVLDIETVLCFFFSPISHPAYRPTDFDPVFHSTDAPDVEYDVTFCSQGTYPLAPSFSLALLAGASCWKFLAAGAGSVFTAPITCSPMSIVYYFPKENESYFLSLKAESNLRPNIIVDYVIQTDPFYFPINTLRNRAIDNVKTTHFWLTDMDVWPSCAFRGDSLSLVGSYDAIMHLPLEFFQDPKNAGIVPVFQMRRHRCRTFQECIN